MEATRYGAIDFLEKPIALQKLLTTCRNVIEEWRTQHQNGAAQGAQASGQPVRRPPAAGGLQPQVSVSADGSYCRVSGTVPVPNPSGKLPAVEVTDLGIVLDFNRGLRDLRDDFERAYLTRVLKLEGGSIAALAKHANVERTHLYRKLRNLGLDVSELTQGDGSALPVYGRSGGSASNA
jgi:DNA-binding NtrC family response regulator